MRPLCSLLTTLALLGCGGRQVLLQPDGGPASVDGTPPTSTPAGCASSAECAPNEYCHRDLGCPAPSARGQCRPRPQGCARDCPGVCGCDGKTYCNACNAQSVGVNVKSEGACGSCEAGCHVRNDCCTCAATTEPGPGPECAMVCDAPRCEAMGIGAPAAYCLAERCLLADTQHRCTVDSDCAKTDSCCFCLAYPKIVPDPDVTCAADCFVGACTAQGLGAAVPRCVGGVCKLTL